MIIKSHTNPLTWIKDAAFLAMPYWKSEERNKSLVLLSLVIVFNLLIVYVSVLFNKWYNVFYDAIQHFDKSGFADAIVRFCVLATIFILLQILSYYFQKILEIRWRRWLTRYYINNWFTGQAFYKTRFLDKISDNPDQRISDDINSFIILLLQVTLGLMNSIVTLASFIFILWKISGNLTFDLFNTHWVIYGYMVWAAILYAIVGTYITFKIGKPLIKLDFNQQAYEADFRYSLVRVRENTENIAFYSGEKPESNQLIDRFTHVVDNFVAIIYRTMKINIFNVAYGQIANIFPIVVASPRYFAKLIQLGDLMQIASAFGKVQDALSYFINAYSALAGWRAVMDRLIGFQNSITNAQNLSGIIKDIEPHSYLTLCNLCINLPNGTTLASNISLDLKSGDRLLIRGRSGSGKTTLLRVIAGLWPFATGNISQRAQLSSLFIAQRPYLPIAELNAAICYPKTNDLPSNTQLTELLTRCELAHLAPRLDKSADWGNVLSIGEQQRIAFCRILVNMPDIVYLDEATSALDEETEDMLYHMITQTLPNALIVSVGHRSTIRKWHNQELDFNQPNFASK